MGEAAASSEVTQVAAATGSQDPEVGLAAVEALQVENARAKGWSWQQIAARLGVTKQAVHHKYAGRRFGFRR
jgi:DNA-binding NarL/FixJ family response regulator